MVGLDGNMQQKAACQLAPIGGGFMHGVTTTLPHSSGSLESTQWMGMTGIIRLCINTRDAKHMCLLIHTASTFKCKQEHCLLLAGFCEWGLSGQAHGQGVQGIC